MGNGKRLVHQVILRTQSLLERVPCVLLFECASVNAMLLSGNEWSFSFVVCGDWYPEALSALSMLV